MSLKLKITFLHIAVSFVTALFIYMIYDSYIASQKKDIENQLMKVLKLNEAHMKRSLSNIEQLLASKKKLTKDIHMSIHDILKKNPVDLIELKNKMHNDFQLNSHNLELEIFLIDTNHSVSTSTHKKNIGLSLSNIERSKTALDSLEQIDQFIQPNDVAVDFLDYEIKSFSYSKLDKKSYLGLGVIYKNSIDEKESFQEMIEISNTNMDLFCVMKDSKNNQYYESLIQKEKKFKSNKEYFNEKRKFSPNEQTDDNVIQTARIWEVQHKKYEDKLSVFIPLMQENNPIMGIPGDIILKVDLDISEENIFVNSILHKLIIFVLLHFLLVFIIFYFTNRYQKIEKELKGEVQKNEDLVEYNKQFISNLVHQIRTPLAITMTNISLLEVIMKKNIKQYSSQINASINMLSNSYENLSYFVSFKTLDYKKRKINLSTFLKERINFFDQIAEANKKSIIMNIEDDCFYEINDIELERIIDNNIANALYFSDYEGVILISLNNKGNSYKMSFKVMSSSHTKKHEALNNEEINYMKDMSSLGLGIYIIKNILHKNTIKYNFKQNKNQLLFEYTLI